MDEEYAALKDEIVKLKYKLHYRRDKYRLLEKERDEWKRQIDIIRRWSRNFTLLGGFTVWDEFLRGNPEAAEWFEGKQGNSEYREQRIKRFLRFRTSR